MSILAFLVMAFAFWRKTKDEHYQEDEVFDAFLLSGLVGLIGARVGYIGLQLPQLGISPGKWIDMSNYPGSFLILGIVAAGWYLKRYAEHHKWDAFELLDFWMTALSAGLSVLWFGMFLDGSYIGDPTKLPWGITFPGLFEKHHPVQLYFAGFFALVCWYLVHLEFRYRTFSWYRGTRNTALTGFVTSVGIILMSVWGLLLSLFVAPTYLHIGSIPLDEPVALVGILFGAGLLYVRSGRSWRRAKAHRTIVGSV